MELNLFFLDSKKFVPRSLVGVKLEDNIYDN